MFVSMLLFTSNEDDTDKSSNEAFEMSLANDIISIELKAKDCIQSTLVLTSHLQVNGSDKLR